MIHHLLKWVDQTLSKTFLCRRASYILIQNLNFKSDFNMVSDLLSYLLNLNILHSLRASLLLNDIFKEASTGCNQSSEGTRPGDKKVSRVQRPINKI